MTWNKDDMTKGMSEMTELVFTNDEEGAWKGQPNKSHQSFLVVFSVIILWNYPNYVFHIIINLSKHTQMHWKPPFLN